MADIWKNTVNNLLSPLRAPGAIVEYSGDDFADGLQITEVTDVSGFDPNGESGNTVFLAGSHLPKAPFTWGGSQRITKEYYPGNPEPAVQVLGSKESNVVLEGRWHTRHHKDGGLVWKLQDYFDALRLRGNLIYLRLGTWARYGYIEENEFRMKNLRDIEWKLTFTILGKEKPFFNFFADTVQEVSLDLGVKMAVATASIVQIPVLPYPNDILDVISTAVAGLFAKVSAVTKFIDGVLSLAEKTIAQIQRCILLIKSVRSEIARFKRRLGFLKVDVEDISTSFNSLERRRYSDAINKAIRDIQHKPSLPVAVTGLSATTLAMLSKDASKSSAANIRTTPSLETMLSRLDKQLKAIARTIPQARHLVQAGDTLAKIAIRYYKDAEQWKRLYDHNKLTSTLLVSGTVLEVPKL